MRIFFRTFLLAFLLALLPATAVFAYSNPGNPKGFVNDYAGLLSAEQKQTLENKLSNFEKETSNEISVVTIENLGGDTIENFALNLFQEWKIGKEKNDNGVLLLIAKEDRKMRIEVGYGLEGALPDAIASQIIRNTLRSNFAQEKYYEGINEATDEMILATKGEYQVKKEKANFSFKTIFELGLIFLWIMFAFLGRSKSWWLGGVIGALGGIGVGFVSGFIFKGIIWIILLTFLGLLFDFVASKYKPAQGSVFPWWLGGGGRGGGFGGFGGGRSGGGGSSGGW